MALSLHQQSELLSGVTNEYLQKLLQNPDMMQELELMEAPVLIEVASRNPDTKPQVNTNTIRDQKLEGMQGGMQQPVMPEGVGEMPAGIDQFAQGGMIPGYHSGGNIAPHPHGPAVGHLMTDDVASLEDRTAEALENLTLPSVMEAYARGLGNLMPSPLDYHAENLDEEGNFISPEGSLYRRLFEPEASEVRALFENDADESVEVERDWLGHIIEQESSPQSETEMSDDEVWSQYAAQLPGQFMERYGRQNNINRSEDPSGNYMDRFENAIIDLMTPSEGAGSATGLLSLIAGEEKRRQEETPEEMDRRLAREEIFGRQEKELGLLRGSHAQEIEDMKTQAFINNLLLKDDYGDSISAIWKRKGEQQGEIADLQGLIDTGRLTSFDEAANRSRQSLFELEAGLKQAMITADRADQIKAAELLQRAEEVRATIEAGKRVTPASLASIIGDLRILSTGLAGENKRIVVDELGKMVDMVDEVFNTTMLDASVADESGY